jgi:hypothetical protein
MEGAAIWCAGWPDTGPSDLRGEKTGAMVFPLAVHLECEQTAESMNELADQDLSLEGKIEEDATSDEDRPDQESIDSARKEA